MINKKITDDWILLGFFYLIFGFVCLVLYPFISENNWQIHGLICIIAATFSIFKLYNFRNNEFNYFIIDNRIVFLISFAVYFLFGASILSFGTDSDIYLATLQYTVDASNAIKIDGLNFIGFGICLITTCIYNPSLFPSIVDKISIKLNENTQIKAIFYLSLIGFISKFYVLSFDNQIYDNTDGQIISGLWRGLSNSLLMVIFLCAIYQGKKSSKFYIYAISLTLFLVFLGLTSFNKTDALTPIMALFGGLTFRYNSKKIILYGMILSFILLSLIGGPVSYSRTNISSINTHSLIERISLFYSGLEAVSEGYDSANYSSWGRLSYTSAQAASIDFYNSNDGGKDATLIPWLFIPRFLAPNKPVMTDTGTEFYTKMTGNFGSSTSPGIFINGYYNLGWIGLIFGSIICGLILAEMAAISRVIILNKNYLLYPIMFSSIYIAFRVDGTILSDYIGVFVIVVYSILILLIFKKYILKILKI